MLYQSTLAEYGKGALSPSGFRVRTSLVLPIKDFTKNMRRWGHGGLTPPRKTAQSKSVPKVVASHFLQWTCIKGFSIKVWEEFVHESGMVASLSSTSTDHPSVAP